MRRRMIDPAFWTDSKLITCSRDSRLLYIGLWNYADDEGFFFDDLPSIKRTLFPDQDFDINASFGELLPFLVKCNYSNNGTQKVAWKIRAFEEWQTINRPTKSKISPFIDSLNTHGALTEDSLSTHAQVKLSKDKITEPDEEQKRIDRILNDPVKEKKAGQGIRAATSLLYGRSQED